MFRTRPAMTMAAVLSLALGLAAVAGAMSLLDAIGLRPLAVAAPAALVQIGAGDSMGRMAYQEYEDLRDRARSFTSVAAYGIKAAGLSGPDAPPEVVLLGAVSENYFDTLGVRARAGRTFASADGKAGAPVVVLLSDRLWRRRFAADPAVVGRAIALNGAAATVVGIAPREFAGLDAIVAPDIWIPMSGWRSIVPGATDSGEVASRDAQWFTLVARLPEAPSRVERARALMGATPRVVAVAQSELDVIAAELAPARPATAPDLHFRVTTLAAARAGRVMIVALLLWIVVGLVLLVGCANVAGLLLGRAEERRREMAMRVAIGAGRPRLVRQLMTESLVLVAVAVSAGVLLGFWLIRSLPLLLPPMALPLGLDFRLDSRAMLVTAGAGVVTVLIFGLWPAFTASRQAVAQTARHGGSGRQGRRARAVLVVGQIAVSCVLLTSGALLGRSAVNSQAIDPGFAVRPLLLVSLSPIAAGYSRTASDSFFRVLTDRLAASPGIERLSLARRVPLDPNGGGAARDIAIPGHNATRESSERVRNNAVAPGYFAIMGTPIVRGRAFTDRDGATAPRVAIVNETMAKRYWPDGQALGARFEVRGPGGGEFEVVGIARDGKINRLTETPQPYMFFALSQMPSSELTVIIQAGADPRRAAPIARSVVAGIDPRMPTLQMLTLEEHLRYGTYEARVLAILVSSLSIAGLILALLGVYSTMSAAVATRTKEIGVRMALGAAPGDILREVAGRTATIAAWGVGLGAGAALAAGRLLAGSLYGVGPSDPATFAAVALGLMSVSLLASWAPCRRAARVDPVDSLRAE